MIRKLEHSFIFCVICLLIFFLTPFIIIYVEKTAYLPHAQDQDYFVGKNLADSRLDQKDFYKLNIGDGQISNIENIIIGVFTLWGFLRLFDLFRIMHNINERDRWLKFWQICDEKI